MPVLPISLESNSIMGTSRCQLGNIRNFAWVHPHVLARGEQPRASDYPELARAGFRTVVSLRERHAPADNVWPPYRVEDEAEACAAVNLNFRHIPILDKVIPEPESIAAALSLLDEEVEAGRPVFVHCLFGVGRTGLIAAAWSLTRMKQNFGDVAETYFDFFSEMYSRNGIPREKFESQHREFRVLSQWWALHTMAAALNLQTEIACDYPPEPPENAEEWRHRCHLALRRWRSDDL